MGILKRISNGLQEHREITRKRETYADYRRIIAAESGGNLSLTSIYADLIPRNPYEYIPSQGEFVFFRYDPKYKKQLSIYDIYPLVYVFGQTETVEPGAYAFFGANLHYINKSKTGGIRNRLYAQKTLLKTLEQEELEVEDFQLLMEELEGILYKNDIVNLIGYGGASLYHKYIQTYIRTQIYSVPEEYTNIMIYLELERFVTN